MIKDFTILTLVYECARFSKAIGQFEYYQLQAQAIDTPEREAEFIKRARIQTHLFFEEGMYLHAFQVYRHQGTFTHKKAILIPFQ